MALIVLNQLKEKRHAVGLIGWLWVDTIKTHCAEFSKN